jgi:mono/diheme cytochrome c family protein
LRRAAAGAEERARATLVTTVKDGNFTGQLLAFLPSAFVMPPRITLLTAALLAAIAFADAQQTPARPAPAAPVRVRPPAFPTRPPADPASVERGKAIFSVNCAFCHGVDARGGSGGTNLIRAESVMNDKEGELIGPVIRAGREGMPKFDLTPPQIADVANFVHSFRVGGYDISRMTPETIVVGDARAGEAYFNKTCSGCHTITGDLKGIAARITDPKALQQHWLMPGSGRGGSGAGRRPVTVTVTQSGGKMTRGRLVRIDDFLVTLIDSDGVPRTFTRDGDSPKVELHDPLKPHRDLLANYEDKNIHDVTAFLVTVK